MTNLLNNPTLTGFSLGRYFTEQHGQVGTIENPTGWEFICYPRESDPEKLPQSLHRDRGFVIAAGFRAWEGGYVQKGIPLEAKQRYLMKAQFKPDINFTDGREDLTAVTWRFRVVSSTGQTVEEDWKMTNKNRLKQEEESTFVFYSAEAQTVDFYFMARSVYAGNVADFNVYLLSLEPVDINYGGASVPILGSTPTAASVASPSTPPPTPIISGPIVTNTMAAPVSPAPSLMGTSGKDLGSVLTAGEIDTIVAGLRELARQVNPSAAAGLNTLADGLERLK
jgi:hypothetical protein